LPWCYCNRIRFQRARKPVSRGAGQSERRKAETSESRKMGKDYDDDDNDDNDDDDDDEVVILT
jgi:hypothetical protein